MNIAKACIKHKVATLLAVIMVVIFGVLFGTRLQMALMPNMEMPMAVVMTTYVGANPSDIEELVTSPLESAIMSVSGVDEITSTSAENVSTIQITYLEGTDLDIAATKLREQFDRVSLPDDASDPIIVNINISELMPTAMIALVGDDLSQLQAKAEDDIAPALERIDGVAQVQVSGGTEQHIAVRIDPAKAAGFGLSNSYISQFLAGQNLLYPGGDLQNGTQKLTVSTDAKFQSVDDVANTIIARALMLMQLMSIGKGYSAVSLEMLEQIRTYLNADLYPYAPCEGTIGGLSFQPYIAITYMGEGRLIDNGKVRPTAEVLAEKGIAPLKVKAREGLALLSNASHSLGVGLLALYDFVMTMRHADLTAALVCEALRSTDKAYDPRLIALKNHKETADTARFLRDILSGSAIMDESRSLRVQDSMNTRIIPHVHGIAKRMAGQTYDALMEELYAVFDNPIFLPDGTALMGSNWDATAIELYCDSLAIAVMDVAKLTEVHMERLVDPHLSGLPAFLVKNPGLNNSFMIPQYVTAGLLGDIALLCAPAAAFNAAVSAGQESPVYRDDTAARQLYQAVQKLRSLVSMTMLTALQAIDLSDHKAMSPVTQKIHDHARQTVTFMENDDLMYQRIEAMEHLVESNQLLADCSVPFTI